MIFDECMPLCRYFGATCDQSTYSAGKCEQLKTCVLCGALARVLPQCRSCGHVTIIRVKAIRTSHTTIQINYCCMCVIMHVINEGATE